MSIGIQKYNKYLSIKHDWDNNNCLTIIRDIYKENLNIDLNAIFFRADTDGISDVDTNWYKKWDEGYLKNELKHWKKINLPDLQEYDILIFISKKSRNMHFGMYIESNTFIHLRERQYVTFNLLDAVWRNMLYGCYRHYELV